MANLEPSFEELLKKQLWITAIKLHKNIDAAEYKHVVLELILNFSPKNVVKL